MNFYLPVKLMTNQYTFNELSKLGDILSTNEQVTISFEKTVFIQPTILAILAQMISQAKKRGCHIKCCHIKQQLVNFLEQYEFFKYPKRSRSNYLAISKFLKNETQSFEQMLRSNLDDLSPEIKLYLMTRMLMLFELMSADETELFVSGYCNLSQDWFLVTFATDRVLFEDEAQLKQAILSGDFLHQRNISFSIFIEELLALGGKCFITTKTVMYHAHKDDFEQLPGKLPNTVISLLIPIHLI